MGTATKAETSGVPADIMRTCLLAATAAPSVHNTQPWLFRVGQHGVDVLVDRRRQLRSMDPEGREMFVSVGAAVFNLRIALRARGWLADADIAPDAADPDLAARVVARAPVPAPAAVTALANAVARRRTNRRPFAETAVPEAILAELSSAAAAEGGACWWRIPCCGRASSA